MLSYLRVVNFALLDDVELTFGSHLNVITGETGAGKSLLLQAVSLLRGARARTDWVRKGAEEAVLEAVFHVPVESSAYAKALQILAKAGLPSTLLCEEGLLVRRVLNAKGRHRVAIAGQLASLETLVSLGEVLIDLSSQHEYQALLDARYQLDMVDQSGEASTLLSKMASVVAQLHENEQQLQQVEREENDRTQREDWIRFQLQEVEQLQLQEGEDERLRQERERLRMAQRLQRIAEQCEQVLTTGENPPLVVFAKVQQELLQGVALEATFGQALEQVREASFAIEEVVRVLRRYAQKQQPDPERLQEVEDRLYLVGKLLRKHGPTAEQVFRRKTEWEQELTKLDQIVERRHLLQKQREIWVQEARDLAKNLSQHRKTTVAWLEEQINAQLIHLALPQARIYIHLTPQVATSEDRLAVEDETGVRRPLTARGWDRCEFVFAPHVGEAPKPLQRVASGGELSRILLACKQVLGRADDILTHVFDEVDAGLGGAIADQVGRQLQQLAKTKQVLCVTHLAQVAALGHAHFLVSKEVGSAGVVTNVRKLTPKEREMEIARMVGTRQVTEKTKAYARELLRLAEKE